MPRQIVVTGLGVISPIGIGVSEFWKAALEGRSGVSAISGFDPFPMDGYRSKVAAQIHGFAPERYLDAVQSERHVQHTLGNTHLFSTSIINEINGGFVRMNRVRNSADDVRHMPWRRRPNGRHAEGQRYLDGGMRPVPQGTGSAKPVRHVSRAEGLTREQPVASP